jgi:glycerol uptake facilitator-like aquaporin
LNRQQTTCHCERSEESLFLPGGSSKVFFCYYLPMSRVAGRAGRSPQLPGFRRLWRVLNQLFHEIVGATFVVLAFAWLNSALRAWTRDTADWLIGVSIAVALLFVFFAVTSFRRAGQL